MSLKYEFNLGGLFINNNYTTEKLECLIRGSWELSILRFHVLQQEFESQYKDRCNDINGRLGVNTIIIDLLELGDAYRKASLIMDIIRDSEQPIWIWFINCEALKNTSLAGWLRSVLTTYYVEHIRVAFVLDNKELYKDIFQNHSTPLYEFTTSLEV